MKTTAQTSLSPPGRNDPCPCGSGRKYKKCCLVQDEAQNIADLEWHRIRQTEGEIIDRHLMPYAQRCFPDDIFDIAWDEFLLYQEYDLPQSMVELLDGSMFLPWLFFNWIPDHPHVLPTLIAQQYLGTRHHGLTPYQRRFIEAACEGFYSFYVVLDVVHEKSLLLKDIFLQTEHTVKERLATHTLERGDIVFDRLVSLDGQSISVGMAPCAFNSRYHIALIEMRDAFITENQGNPLTPEILKSYEDDLHEEMLSLMELQFNPPLPDLRNTDGDPIQNHTLKFNLGLSAEEALHKLMPLTLSQDPQEFLRDAKRTRKKDIKSIEFPWLKKGNKIHKEWDNTTMGHLTLSYEASGATLLTVTVNSQRRAEKIQKLLQKYLKDGFTHKSTRIQSFLEMMRQINSSKAQKAREADEALNAQPEVQAILAEMSKKHWESWLDESLPILNDQTPREAVKTLAGREKVEAVLLEFERKNEETYNVASPDVSSLRQKLGL